MSPRHSVTQPPTAAEFAIRQIYRTQRKRS